MNRGSDADTDQPLARAEVHGGEELVEHVELHDEDEQHLPGQHAGNRCAITVPGDDQHVRQPSWSLRYPNDARLAGCR